MEEAWVRFDPAKPETWPPANNLSLLYDSRWGFSLGTWHQDDDLDEGGAWYDENSDYDDGWEANDERWWRLLPPPPEGID